MKKLVLILAILFSFSSLAKFIDQNDIRFIAMNLKQKDIDSSLCGPVSVSNWLIDNNVIKELDGFELIKNISAEVKIENNIDVKNGLTTNELKTYLDNVAAKLKLTINPVESDLFSFNYETPNKQKELLSVLNANKNQILLVKFMEIKRRSFHYNPNSMDDYFPGENEPLYSFHYVYKKGVTKDGKLLVIDPEMPEKILTFQYDKNDNGLYLIGTTADAFRYVTIPNFEAQIKSIISLKN